VGAEPVSIFVNQYQSFYFWEFETGTTLDLTPPIVKAVRPRENSMVPKNNIVQVYFTEAMDPTVTQGYMTPDTISNLFFDTAVTGTWKLSNGYSVAEFVSGEACGVNSCGEIMYCLPLPSCINRPGDKDCAENYQALVRAGRLLNNDGISFEAEPFSGVMDMAGNSLDGNKNDVAEQRPDSSLNFAGQQAPDNFYWPFVVQNKIDRVAPVVETVLPEIDKDGVKGKDNLKILFSKVMWLSTLYSPNTFLEEYPRAIEASAGTEHEIKDVLGFWPDSELKVIGGVDKTETRLRSTREFGPYELDLYYFPQVYSKVKTETQNCLYPGRGTWGVKGTAPTCVYTEDESGHVVTDTNCIPVNIASTTDTGCAETTDLTGILQPDVPTCLKTMKDNSLWGEQGEKTATVQ
jgi:hypothetical protein